MDKLYLISRLSRPLVNNYEHNLPLGIPFTVAAVGVMGGSSLLGDHDTAAAAADVRLLLFRKYCSG